MIVSLNGSLIDERNAAISIHDAGFLNADGVFETALVHDGGFFRLRHHLDRFANSAAVMNLQPPHIDQLDRTVRQVVAANSLPHANVRITLTRGSAGHTTLLVTARAPDPAWTDRARAGWHVITARTRRPSTAAVPAQLKALGRTYSLLARHEAAAAGVDDALLLTDDGTICEGPTWNVFWRTGDELFTPALEAGVLAGVTRAAVVDIARELGVIVHEGLYPRHVLDDADEILATMTSVGLVDIRTLDGRDIAPGQRLASRITPLYLDRLHAECRRDAELQRQE